MRLLLPLKPAQGPQLPAGQWMDRLGAAFEPPDMQAAMGEVDGVPAQRHQLGRPRPVPVGDQHHGGIAVAVAILPASIDQAGNLAISEVLAGADLGVTFAARRVWAIANCPNNGGCRHQRQMRICHDFSGLFQCYCPKYGPSRDTAQGKKRRFYRNNFDFGAGGRTGQHARNGELADIFCRWATDATPAMASKGWANGGLRFTG